MIPSFEHRHAKGGRALAMGGGGSSSSRNETTTKDSRISLQSGTATSGDNNVVNVLDGNAINKSFDFGTTALTKSLTFAATSNQQALDTLKETSSLVKDAYADAKGRGAMTDKILIGAVAMAGLVAIMALRK